MAEVSFSIGGRGYRLACRDGEEEALLAASRLLDAKVSALVSAHGTISEARLLLMGALQLAGELHQARSQPAPAATPAAELQRLAERTEALAAKLEKWAATE